MGVQRANELEQYVGQKLRDVRTSKGLTQAWLAQTLNVTFQQIQRYEDGENRISCVRLMMAADALKMPLNAFFPEPEFGVEPPARVRADIKTLASDVEERNFSEIDRMIGERLKRVRLDRGLTRRQVADALNISWQLLQKYEVARNRITVGRLWDLAKAMGVPVFDLYLLDCPSTIGGDPNAVPQNNRCSASARLSGDQRF